MLLKIFAATLLTTVSIHSAAFISHGKEVYHNRGFVVRADYLKYFNKQMENIRNPDLDDRFRVLFLGSISAEREVRGTWALQRETFVNSFLITPEMDALKEFMTQNKDGTINPSGVSDNIRAGLAVLSSAHSLETKYVALEFMMRKAITITNYMLFKEICDTLLNAVEKETLADTSVDQDQEVASPPAFFHGPSISPFNKQLGHFTYESPEDLKTIKGKLLHLIVKKISSIVPDQPWQSKETLEKLGMLKAWSSWAKEQPNVMITSPES